MSRSGSTIVDSSFSERVARIEARRAKAPDTPRRKPRGDGIFYVLSLVAAFCVGMLVVVAARYARFHLTGVTPGSAHLNSSNLMVDMGLAFLAGFILQQIFHFKRPEHTAAKTVGMFAAAFTMHMAVHAFPGLFALLFSETWVHHVIRLTDPTKLALF
ncbi:hypothetical protein [Nioella aestuarii]|uniref:hypothetical protein n=1 Tax=Nioella aestuarii TaxID=1662864 RepID=UPI003D7F38C1